MLKGESYLSVWRRELLIAAFALSVVVTVIFGVRAFQQVPHKRVDERIRPWMSISYVAHSHHIPPPVLYEALGLTTKPRDKRSLKQIAREQKRPVEEVIAVLQKAIAQARPPFPPPPSPEKSPGTR